MQITGRTNPDSVETAKEKKNDTVKTVEPHGSDYAEDAIPRRKQPKRKAERIRSSYYRRQRPPKCQIPPQCKGSSLCREGGGRGEGEEKEEEKGESENVSLSMSKEMQIS
uniref:Uncharacterized protein n=1 Tax=Oryza rufipogon TaxID=4529 RepID=A0A0E0N813_ORYRU